VFLDIRDLCNWGSVLPDFLLVILLEADNFVVGVLLSVVYGRFEEKFGILKECLLFFLFVKVVSSGFGLYFGRWFLFMGVVDFFTKSFSNSGLDMALRDVNFTNFEAPIKVCGTDSLSWNMLVKLVSSETSDKLRDTGKEITGEPVCDAVALLASRLLGDGELEMH